MADAGIEQTTLNAMERQKANAEREAHMAMLYFFNVGQFRILRERGSLVANRPAPLSADDIKTVFAQLVKHPGYRSFSFTAVAQDGTVVTMTNGEIK